MLSDEVSHIQEVRYCLKNLRQQMEARNSGKNGQYKTNGYRVPQPSSQSSVSNCAVGGAAPQTKEWEEGVLSERESDQMRELTRRLYGQFQTKLQEAEHRHQEERARLEVESSEMRQQLCQQGESLQQAEEELGERDARIGELSRLLSGMEVEQRTLLERMRESEGELQQLRTLRDEGRAKEERSEELEKELAILKEKIHHLDDMLKCQQRKVRHMIEQLQNSRTVIQERDRVIRELQEKVAFLEAENREMHDQMDHFLSHRRAAPSTSERNSKIVYSKPLTPSSTSKTLPFIKVIEIKS
ncbi:tuftelin 1a isoform X2 [Amia ocellicauda]